MTANETVVERQNNSIVLDIGASVFVTLVLSECRGSFEQWVGLEEFC